MSPSRLVGYQIPALVKLSMEFLRAAIAAGGTPHVAASGATVLRDGRKFKQLVTSAGKLTDAGRLYQGETGTVLETNSYDTAQAPRREGNAEYISTRRGQDKVIRRWDAAMSKWSYTAVGRKFFAQKRIQYVVKVPVTFEGKRANGTPYRRQGYFPLSEPIAIKMTDSQVQRDEKIKAHVRSLYPSGVLAEYSEETITIREGAEWHIVEMTTELGAACEDPRTDVTERPWRAGPPVRDWEAWCCAKPGHFWAYEEDIDKVCGEFLAQGRHPKVVRTQGRLAHQKPAVHFLQKGG